MRDRRWGMCVRIWVALWFAVGMGQSEGGGEDGFLSQGLRTVQNA